ncbi:hypothetical protein PC116_g31092, partial [Phytophthora cactorum]
MDKANYDEAISVLGMLEDALLKDKTGTLREAKMLKAEVLFKKRKFAESLALFIEDEVHAPAQRVLRLYPRIIAGDLSAEPAQEETSEEEEEQEEDEKANGGKATRTDASVEVASPSKPGAFAKYWMGHRKTDSDTASITSSKRGGTDNEDTASVTAKPGKKKKKKKKGDVDDDGPLEGKDLIKAVRELNGYLAGTRARLQRWIDPATGKLKPRKAEANNGSMINLHENLDILLPDSPSESDEQLERELKQIFTVVDTALFRGLMFVTPTLAGSLFRIPNFCDPAVVNEHLLKHNRYNELVDFFYGKKLHREALTLLRKFGNAETDGESAKLDLNGQANAEVVIPEQLRGPQRT